MEGANTGPTFLNACRRSDHFSECLGHRNGYRAENEIACGEMGLETKYFD